jgi:outer membrane autotransporter protein
MPRRPRRPGRRCGRNLPGFAAEEAPLPPEIAQAYAAVFKAPRAPRPPQPAVYVPHWTPWGTGYGGENRTSGDPVVVGSHDLRASTGGFAAGAAGLCARRRRWSLAQGLGSGQSDAFQVGVYGTTRSGPFYVAGAFGFTEHWMSTDRFSFTSDHLTAKFDAQSYGGRAEAGYRFAVPYFAAAPYAAVQPQAFVTPGFTESDPSGAGFGLAFASHTATDTRSELGSRFEAIAAASATSVLALRAKVAWAHDWVSDPSLGAVFQALPGASFTVNGAAPPHDSTLASAGAEWRFANGFALGAKFDGEFAARSQTYASTGTVRYLW